MVTGKGGTGKTTYAAALAILGAAKGKRTLLCEIDNQRPSLTAIFGVVPEYVGREVRPGLAIANLHFAEAIGTFVEQMVPVRRVVKLVLENAVVQKFMDFAPGARELVTLAALVARIEQYDLVVVDMPASGHAFSLLDILRSALGLFRSGPVRKLAHDLRTSLLDDRTRMVFVALPEEMVVNETLETVERMRKSEILGGEPVVILNKATLPSLTDDERALIAKLGEQELTPLQEEFVRAGRWEDQLEQATAEARDRLTTVFQEPPLLVPPAGAGGVVRLVVAAAAVHLGRQVGVTRRDLSWI